MKKVAIVCDWLTNVGGAEQVLRRVHKMFPDAPIYTSKYDKKHIHWFDDADVRTGWLQIFPTKMRRFLGIFRQRYFSHLDLSDYDIIISVTGAEAKSVKKGNAVHFCYCHVPTQYYWQMYDEYVKNPGFGILNPLVRFFFKLFVKPLRKADFKAAKRPDYFITISEHAKKQIKKYYQRDAVVIHPSAEVEEFRKVLSWGEKQKSEEAPYIIVARQVNWKRLDLCVKACLELKRPLVIIGDGPEHKRLVKMAAGAPFIEFLPVMDREQLKKRFSTAKGFLFPSLEPFGIAPVEALATGCPVIAFKEGGSLDYIKDGKNGVFFEKQTKSSLVDAILRFEKIKFNKKDVSASAESFSPERFDKELADYINKNS